MGRHRKVEVVDDEFRLLFVCTGNICRSPFAEILTRHLLVGRLGGRLAGRFDLSSAGVRAVVGAPMHPDSRAQLAPWKLEGRQAEGFAARQLLPAMAESAHLVLGVSPEHRSAAIDGAPAVVKTAFGLLEFARLMDSIDTGRLPAEPVARAHGLVEEARTRRGLVPPMGPVDDRIPDPMGRGPAAHRAAAVLLHGAVQKIVEGIVSR